jgi:hypothetical protein
VGKIPFVAAHISFYTIRQTNAQHRAAKSTEAHARAPWIEVRAPLPSAADAWRAEAPQRRPRTWVIRDVAGLKFP